jgi:hypothetical protein
VLLAMRKTLSMSSVAPWEKWSFNSVIEVAGCRFPTHSACPERLGFMGGPRDSIDESTASDNTISPSHSEADLRTYSCLATMVSRTTHSECDRSEATRAVVGTIHWTNSVDSAEPLHAYKTVVEEQLLGIHSQERGDDEHLVVDSQTPRWHGPRIPMPRALHLEQQVVLKKHD